MVVYDEKLAHKSIPYVNTIKGLYCNAQSLSEYVDLVTTNKCISIFGYKKSY